MIEHAVSFVAVVKAGGFSSAVQSTGISKACLSRHVKQLEEELGVQLLHRTTRTVLLTDAGKKFYEACQQIEENYREAVNDLTQDFNGMQGTLRVTAPIDFGIQFLPPIIETFSKMYPKMNVILSLSNVNEMIAQQNYDLAFRIAGQLPDSTLRMSKLLSFKRLLCVSPDYLKHHEKVSSIEALKQHRCITSVNRNVNAVKPQWQFVLDKKTMNCVLEEYIEADSLFAQLELIKRGCGIGRMPDYFISDALKSGELIEVLPEIQKPNFYVYLLYPDGVGLPHKTRAFIDITKKAIGTVLP